MAEEEKSISNRIVNNTFIGTPLVCEPRPCAKVIPRLIQRALNRLSVYYNIKSQNAS